MLVFNLIVLFLIEMAQAQRNVPGKVTGIPSLPHEVLVLEFKPKVEAIKIILTREIENMDRQVRLAQSLVQNNAATSRTIASQKIKELKQAISTAKEEAKYANMEVKMCISRQEYETPQSFTVPAINCLMNYTDMTGVRNKLVKLQIITGQLLSNCQQLHMDDSEKDVTLLRKCLAERTDDTFRHITRMREELNTAFGNIMMNSLQCVMERSFDTFRSIGGVMSSLKSCKNSVIYKMKKLP